MRSQASSWQAGRVSWRELVEGFSGKWFHKSKRNLILGLSTKWQPKLWKPSALKQKTFKKYSSSDPVSLKVHKIEIFLASILKFVLFLYFHDWAILGRGTIFPRSPRTTGNKNCFQPRPFFFFNIIYDPFICAKNIFSKIRSNNCVRDAFSVNLGPKCQNLFPLVWD